MRIVLTLFLLMTALSLPAWSQQRRAPSKAALLTSLESWTRSVRLWNPDRVEALEKDIWLSFLYRLRAQVSSSYQDSDASLIRILTDINEVELSSENKTTSRLSPFLTLLLQAVREDREPTEDLFSFMKEFAEYGGILTPPTPEEFMETREYRGGGLSEAAQPMDLEAAAESLEIQELAKTMSPELPPEPAVLDPTKGSDGTGADEVVPSHEPRFEPPRNSGESTLIL